MSLTAAIFIALVLAVFGFPFAMYDFWWSWSPVSTIVISVVYFGVAGVAGGALGWAAAQVTGASVPGGLVINGLLYGATGAAVLRADFSLTGMTKKSLQSDLSVKDTLSLLGQGIGWAKEGFTLRANQRAEVWFYSLDVDALDKVTRRLSKKIAAGGPNDAAVMAKLVPFKEAIENLRSNDQELKDDGRAGLIQLHLAVVEENQTPKPPKEVYG